MADFGLLGGIGGLSQGFIQGMRDMQDRNDRLKESAEERALRKLQLDLAARGKGYAIQDGGLIQDPSLESRLDQEAERKLKYKIEEEKGLLPYKLEEIKARSENDPNKAILQAIQAQTGMLQQQKLKGDIAEQKRKEDEASAKQTKLQTQKEAYGKIIQDDISRALNLIESSPYASGSVAGQSKRFPGTPAYDLEYLLDTVKSNASFDKLQQMREASPTGGALGSVSDKEMSLLQSAAGKIDTAMKTEDLVYNLKRYYNTQMDIVHGPGNGPQRYDLGKGLMGQQPQGLMQTVGPSVGQVEDGYRFKGGDPKNSKNWEKIK